MSLKVGERGEADDQPQVRHGRGRCKGCGFGPEGRQEACAESWLYDCRRQGGRI